MSWFLQLFASLPHWSEIWCTAVVTAFAFVAAGIICGLRAGFYAEVPEYAESPLTIRIYRERWEKRFRFHKYFAPIAVAIGILGIIFRLDMVWHIAVPVAALSVVWLSTCFSWIRFYRKVTEHLASGAVAKSERRWSRAARFFGLSLPVVIIADCLWWYFW